MAATVLVIAPAASAKNYLVIIMDDVGPDKVASYAGDFPGYTPSYLPTTRTIDTLAARGLRFTHAWATPMCSPTRAAFQSGRQPSITGVGTVLERGAPDLDTTLYTTIANQFAARGYATGLFGKYHIGLMGFGGAAPPTTPTFTVRPHPSLAGWDRFFGSYYGTIATGPGTGYFNWDRIGWIGGATGSGFTGIETTHATDRTEQVALQWINGQTTPWLAVVAFNAAHSATTAGSVWNYGDEDPAQVRSTTALACLSNSPPNCPDRNKQVYQALVEHMDIQIQALLSGMTTAQRQDTVVVLFGDNGTPDTVEESVFDVAGRGKESTYENGVRVPLIIADASAWATGVAGSTISLIGRDIDLNVNTLDIFNTLYSDAFGLPVALPVPTRPLDSTSFKACFAGNDPTCGLGSVYKYTETFPSNAAPDGAKIAVAYGTDTMVACYKPAPDSCMKEAFYDVSVDPLQTTPKSWPGIRAQRLRDYFTTFHTGLTDWATTTGAVVPFCAATVAACP